MKPFSAILLMIAAFVLGAASAYLYLGTKDQRESTPSPTPSLSASASPEAPASPEPTPFGAEGITLTAPLTGTIVTNPLTVTGTATGSWYSEGQFQVKLLDKAGTILAQGTAKADGEWMTESASPFSATLSFATPSGDTGSLVIENDNPSGLPENAKSFSVPVKFR